MHFRDSPDSLSWLGIPGNNWFRRFTVAYTIHIYISTSKIFVLNVGLSTQWSRVPVCPAVIHCHHCMLVLEFLSSHDRTKTVRVRCGVYGVVAVAREIAWGVDASWRLSPGSGCLWNLVRSAWRLDECARIMSLQRTRNCNTGVFAYRLSDIFSRCTVDCEDHTFHFLN